MGKKTLGVGQVVGLGVLPDDCGDKSKISVYFKNGNVFEYEVACATKSREHAEKIWNYGLRAKIGDRHEWFGPHYIDKICWTNDNTCLAEKYHE